MGTLKMLLEVIGEDKHEQIIYKDYPHEAKYLRKLNALSERIEDWQDLGNHLKFLTWLEDVHGKKSSFWRHYQG